MAQAVGARNTQTIQLGSYPENEGRSYGFLALTVRAVLSLKVASLGTCGSQTEVCLADSTDANGEPQFKCTAAADGAKVKITADQNEHGARICGAGKFHFSPMQCDGSNFDYQKQ